MTSARGYLQPIFIGGCDRSGTTLLGATLARFPGVVTLPESQFIYETAQLRKMNNAPLDELADYISAHPRFDAWRETGCAPAHQHLKRDLGYRDFMDALMRDYARATGVNNVTAFVDHSPRNSENVRILKCAYDDMRFCHIIRDGRAVAASLMPQDWGPNDILEAAQVWEASVAAGLAASDYLGGAARNLRFEALVTGEEATLAAIAAVAGANSFERAYEQSTFRIPGYAGETHAMVSRKPSPDRADAWRRQLSARQVEIFEHSVGALLESLGYELVYPRGGARKASHLEWAAIRIKRWASYRRNHGRMRARYAASRQAEDRPS